MRLTVLSFFTVFILCIESLIAQKFLVHSSNGKDVPMYEKAGSGETLAFLPNNELVTTLGKEKTNETWYKVQYGEDIGYISEKNLKAAPSSMLHNFVPLNNVYQQSNIQKIVLIQTISEKTGYCYLIEIQGDNVKILHRFNCLLGANGIDKQVLGDKKTPLGHYYVTSESEINSQTGDAYNIFGGYNIHLNYPNPLDVSAGKTGSSICIHGGYRRNTRGCVRILDNDGVNVNTQNIKIVGDFVSKGTNVIISPYMPSPLVGEKNKQLPHYAKLFFQSIVKQVQSHSKWRKIVRYVNENDSNIVIGKIADLDGYVNVRSNKSTQKPPLEEVRNTHKFLYTKTSEKWYPVISPNGNLGYIYYNRIK